MRKIILITSLAAALAAAAPGLASAQNACERVKHNDKVAGTIFGAIGGAILGDIVAGHGHKGDGAAVGALGGAVVGNQLARSDAPCPDGYARYGDDRGTRAYAPAPVYEGDWGHDRNRSFDSYRAGYERRDHDGWGYGYDRRECRVVTRTYYEPDGDRVTREERICR